MDLFDLHTSVLASSQLLPQKAVVVVVRLARKS